MNQFDDRLSLIECTLQQIKLKMWHFAHEYGYLMRIGMFFFVNDKNVNLMSAETFALFKVHFKMSIQFGNIRVSHQRELKKYRLRNGTSLGPNRSLILYAQWIEIFLPKEVFKSFLALEREMIFQDKYSTIYMNNMQIGRFQNMAYFLGNRICYCLKISPKIGVNVAEIYIL